MGKMRPPQRRGHRWSVPLQLYRAHRCSVPGGARTS